MWQTGSLKILPLHLDGTSRSLGAEAAAAAGLGWESPQADLEMLPGLAAPGCSPAGLMTEAVTGSSSQALEDTQFLPDPPLTQQRISSYSFT